MPEKFYKIELRRVQSLGLKLSMVHKENKI